MSVNRRILLIALTLSTLIGIGACTDTDSHETETLAESQGTPSSGQTSNQQTGAKNFTHCTEPRPQLCTQEYNPVCASLQGGGTRTYANGCTACGDPVVSGYIQGACE